MRQKRLFGAISHIFEKKENVCLSVTIAKMSLTEILFEASISKELEGQKCSIKLLKTQQNEKCLVKVNNIAKMPV